MLQSIKSLGTASLLGLAVATTGVTMVGCETDAPGIKSNYVQQWSTVAGDVETVTDAAESVLSDYNLTDVDSKTTKIDGTAMGMKADGTEITVDVRKVTADSSEVSVRVGTTGDNELGKEIIKKIEKQLAE